MFTALDRRIPDTVEDLLREPCALVVWDMQEAIARLATNFDECARNISELAASARSCNIPIIYSQHYSAPVEFEDRVRLRNMLRQQQGDATKLHSPYLRETPGWAFVPETAPAETDLVIPKNRPSFFVGTPFEAILAARGIDVVVMVGVATDRGVLTTAREAVNRGVFVVVPEDAVGSFSDEDQARGLEELRACADLCATETVLAAWTAR